MIEGARGTQHTLPLLLTFVYALTRCTVSHSWSCAGLKECKRMRQAHMSFLQGLGVYFGAPSTGVGEGVLLQAWCCVAGS